MSVVRVDVTPPYDVLVAPGALGEAAAMLPGVRRVAIVSQPEVADRYLDARRARASTRRPRSS